MFYILSFFFFSIFNKHTDLEAYPIEIQENGKRFGTMENLEALLLGSWEEEDHEDLFISPIYIFLNRKR